MNRFFTRLSLPDKIMLIRQLSILMQAQIPLLVSLKMLKEQHTGKTMNAIMSQLILDVENGQSLSVAMGKFSKVFGSLSVQVIAVGELSGQLGHTLDQLALTLKKNQSLRRKLISASVYPIFIVMVTIAITVGLTVFIFPKIIPVFKSIHYQLPWTTRFLIFINTQVAAHGLFIMLGLIVFVITFLLLLRVKKYKIWYEHALLKSPFLGRLIKTYYTANITRTLGLLLSSSITLPDAFLITSHATSHLLYKKQLEKIQFAITKGASVAASINKDVALFPIMVAQMIEVGESTGRLDQTLLYLADTYQEEMDEVVKNVSGAIEPVLLMFMGLLVGFVAISIITPMYGITQYLTPK